MGSVMKFVGCATCCAPNTKRGDPRGQQVAHPTGAYLGACLLFLLLLPMTASAFCFERAEATYGIHRDLLRAIAQQESSLNPAAINKNANGSVDVGLMQINSQWWPRLTRAGFDTAWLLDPCYNVMFGSWILAQNVARRGMTWEAVGAYHSPTDWRARQYSVQIAGRLAKILRQPPK